MKTHQLIALAVFALLLASVQAQDITPDYLRAQPKVVEAWQDMRFGMFLCWGPVSLTGKEIGWSRGAPRGGEFRVREGQGETPVEVYDNLYKQWRPDSFDARQWVQLAKDAGQKYMIFLVKHHDGFCLYDSKLTDYKSTGPASAWKHDVMRDVADACHEMDLKLIVYYSQPDWHHPDYRSKHHQRYIAYLHGQIRELCTHYGRIDGFWFDLGGKPEDWDSERLFSMMRTLQPWLIINNRCGLPGDFDTPEQRLGQFQMERPWETCMTLNSQWSWKPNDPIKSLKQCIDVLVTCAVRNGNLALNTGPMPNGQIEARQAQRFREIGRWLQDYGQSIYGTRGGPFVTRSDWGGSTRQGNLIYLHILKWPGDTLQLPALERKIVSHSVLTGGRATVEQNDEGICITVPARHRRTLDTIVLLQLDGSAMDIEPIIMMPAHLRHALSLGKRATASSQWSEQYSAAMVLDGDMSTRWGGAPDSRANWLTIDLGQAQMVNRVWISEYDQRVQAFDLQVKTEGDWTTVHKGTTLGEGVSLTVDPVRARHIRLNITEASNVPTIWEFQVFAPDK